MMLAGMPNLTVGPLLRRAVKLVRPSVSIIALCAAVVLTVSCGADSDAPSKLEDSAGVGGQPAVVVQRIFPEARQYSVSDLNAAGMKVLNEYEVAEFPGAVTAVHGAFQQIEYEARFYASHDDAVAMGAGPAGEVSGPDAVVTGDSVKYQEGATHRRLCSRAAQTPHSGCSYSARYGDYVIKGNMVLLCEGTESEKALIACSELLAKVPPS